MAMCIEGLAHNGVDTSSPERNGRRFADDIFKCIFVNEKSCIFNPITLKFILKGALTEKIGPGNNLAANRRQAITWTNANSVHIYEVLERDDLKKMLLKWKMEAILSSAHCIDIMLFFSLSLMYVVK